MGDKFIGHRFLVHPVPVAWIEYSLQQKLDSEEGTGFDVSLANRLQEELGSVAGEIRVTDGTFRKVYSQPRGFPQSFHHANWTSEGPYLYLVDEGIVNKLPITPAHVSSSLALVRIELPQQDISWQFSDDFPGPIMEEIPLTHDQEFAINSTIARFHGELLDDPFEPLITVPWVNRTDLMAALKVLAPVK